MIKIQRVKELMKQLMNKNDLFLSVFLAGAFVAAVFFTTGIFFETNDDRYITEILSGVIAVEPDAHVVYVNYLLALPLSWLYRITSRIPWYGGFLILLHFFVYVTIAYQMLSLFKSWIEKIVALGVVGFLFAAHMYCMGEIQYTSTAALLAVAGYVCLISRPEKGKWCFFIFELLAYLLRSKAMLMIQPFGMAAMLGIVLMDGRKIKEKIVSIARCGGILLVIFLIGFAGNFIGYSHASWEAYERFNDARTTMFDMYGVLTYEEAKPILDKYDVTENEYNSFLFYSILNWDVSVECIEELEEAVVSLRPKTFEISNIWAGIKNTFAVNYLWGMNRLRILVMCTVLIWIVVCRRWKLILPILGICAGSLIVWGYLVWQGRLPERVAIPLAFCETTLFLLLLSIDYKNSRKQLLARIGLLILCICFCKMAYNIGIKEYRHVKQVNAGQSVYIEGMYEIEDYCRENPENKYLLESYSTCYYRGGPLDTELYKQRNSIVTGCWYSNSPVMREKLKDYLEDVDVDNLKLIVYVAGENDDYAVIQYLEEKLGREAVEEDLFTVSHGGSYRVYGFGMED